MTEDPPIIDSTPSGTVTIKIDDIIASIQASIRHQACAGFTVTVEPAFLVKVIKHAQKSPAMRRSWREYRNRHKGSTKADWRAWKWSVPEWLETGYLYN